jgi:hypothetical protein
MNIGGYWAKHKLDATWVKHVHIITWHVSCEWYIQLHGIHRIFIPIQCSISNAYLKTTISAFRRTISAKMECHDSTRLWRSQIHENTCKYSTYNKSHRHIARLVDLVTVHWPVLTSNHILALAWLFTQEEVSGPIKLEHTIHVYTSHNHRRINTSFWIFIR